jgi:hypothetical protein
VHVEDLLGGGCKRAKEHICWMNSPTVMFTVFTRVTPCSLEHCEISGFGREEDENYAVLSYYAACSVIYRRFGITYRPLLQGSRILGSSPLKELPLNAA